MGWREWNRLEHWKCRWPGKKTGRYAKRQLAKARRRFTKNVLEYGRGKSPSHYESECNWKTW